MHTLTPPAPGPQRFTAARLAFCGDGRDDSGRPGASHVAVYLTADEGSRGAAGTEGSHIAVYQLSGEAAGAVQLGLELQASVPVSSAACYLLSEIVTSLNVHRRTLFIVLSQY